MSDKGNGITKYTLGIISTALVSLLVPQVRAFLLKCWDWTILKIGQLFEMATSTYIVDAWYLWLLFLLSTILIVLVVVFMVVAFCSGQHSNYKTDKLYGAIWKWTWSGNRAESISPFCPTCDGTLVWQYVYTDGWKSHVESIRFDCENCSRQISSVKGADHPDALRVIGREVERRFRTKEYIKEEQK